MLLVTSAIDFISEPKLLRVIPGDSGAVGVTVVNNELFIVRAEADKVEVYDMEALALKRHVTIHGMKDPWGLAACSHNNCLYISDNKLRSIRRVDLSTDKIASWSIGCAPCGLSITIRGTLLVTVMRPPKMQEYTSDGILKREVKLDVSVRHPLHAVQQSSGLLVVSHGSSGQNRVCIIADTTGCILRSYGESTYEALKYPRHLALDVQGNVLVTDSYNNRVVVLYPTLNYFGCVSIQDGHKLCYPYALHLDQLSGRLYIGERYSCMVLVSSNAIAT